MLNHNKRSITVDAKHPKGKAVLESLVKHCDVLVENFAPGALDRMGLTWEHIQSLEPTHDRRVGQGLRSRARTKTARSTRTSRNAPAAPRRPRVSTTDRRLVTGAQIGDSGTGLAPRTGHRRRALPAQDDSGRGQRVLAAMQDGVLNLCRVKLRDQQRLDRTKVMEEYPQYPNGKFLEAVPRARATRRAEVSRGGSSSAKVGRRDPNAYIYFITQAPVWKDICEVIGRPEWLTDPRYATPKARLPHLMEIFGQIEEWTKTKTKFEAMDILNQHDIPCGPILSMKEIAEEPSLRKTGTVVEVDHPTRGKYLTVGNPIKMSDSATDVTRSPLLGEHTDQVLAELGFSADAVAEMRAEKAI